MPMSGKLVTLRTIVFSLLRYFAITVAALLSATTADAFELLVTEGLVLHLDAGSLSHLNEGDPVEVWRDGSDGRG